MPMLAFYDFPAEHWDHLRTKDGIEVIDVPANYAA